MTAVATRLIKLYRALISPILGPSCRFTPTCSEYALEALEKHSFATASRLILSRLGKCHPFGSHGIDLVPDKK